MPGLNPRTTNSEADDLLITCTPSTALNQPIGRQFTEMQKSFIRQYDQTTAALNVSFLTCHSFGNRRGKSTNAQLRELVTKLVWLQLNTVFTLNLRWMRSADNKEADGLSRSDKKDYIRLSEEVFDQLWRAWGGFDLDMMATTASAQRIPRGHGNEGEQLHETEGSAESMYLATT